jgi:hypothetical protein
MVGMNWFAFTLVLVAVVIGVIDEFQTKGRSIYGWAIVALGSGVILDLATKWAHTIRLG